MATPRLLGLLCVLATASPAVADDALPVRARDATFADMFRGPFQSSRLYSMPTADVIGAYMFSMSGDGSLLQDPGVLTSAGVLAIGFGDIAQLEYRHTAAISVTGVNAPLPAVGVQLKVPIPAHANVPALGVAFRLGVPRRETFGAFDVEESVTDLYLVIRQRFSAAPWLTLHAGARISSAKVEVTGEPAPLKRTLVLPAGGVELEMNREARLVGELVAAPRFRWPGAVMPGATEPPTIGYGMIARFGLRWSLLPSVILDGTIGYQTEVGTVAPSVGPRDVVHQWDIRLGAEVFVPWGALACRALGAFCD